MIFSFILLLTSSLCFYTSSAFSRSESNIWVVLRSQFTLNHEINQPEVKKQIRWIIAHPTYIKILTKQAEPYIYHVLSEIKKRKMPGEIALLPMIESAYDPFAYSRAGASGLWQLMPSTGSELGLKQDWWFDGRRSVSLSTNAALNYLTQLNKSFKGHWILALAAYDSGGGTISKAIRKSRQSRQNARFWSLSLPRETKAYIPRLLALAEVIQHPQRYNIKLPEIQHKPYFEEVNIGSQIDLNHAAKLAGISYKELIQLNPGYNRWATAPYKPYKLLIPAERVDDFNRKLAHLPEEKRVSWTRHQIRSSENLSIIAHKYHTTIHLIKELNQLESNSVKKGQYILIPSAKNVALNTTNKNSPTEKNQPSSPSTPLKNYKVIHIVQKRDSYEKLEKKYGVTAAEIRTWNQLAPQAHLQQGLQLVIWRNNKALKPGIYLVKSGDNLSRIAKSQHIRLSALLKLNPNLKGKLLHPGQRILIT